LKQKDKITPELVQQCIQDERNAIKILYEFCFTMLIPICLRYHRHQEDARSSFHLAFMKILKHLKTAPTTGNEFFSWSKRITVNTLIDEYRKEKNKTQREIAKESNHEIEIHQTNILNDGEHTLEYQMILQLVQELPSLTSKVFNLHVIDGYPHKEIAKMLDMSEGTSKWHLSNGRKLLREKLTSIELRKKVPQNITV